MSTVSETTHGEVRSTAQAEAFDAQRAETFEARIVDVLNHGALCLMISIGHRTGLFDTMAALGSASPEAIAAHAGSALRNGSVR